MIALASHRVRTLPQLLLALSNLVEVAGKNGGGPINLANFNPSNGCDVVLARDDAGLLTICFKRAA